MFLGVFLASFFSRFCLMPAMHSGMAAIFFVVVSCKDVAKMTRLMCMNSYLLLRVSSGSF